MAAKGKPTSGSTSRVDEEEQQIAKLTNLGNLGTPKKPSVSEPPQSESEDETSKKTDETSEEEEEEDKEEDKRVPAKMVSAIKKSDFEPEKKKMKMKKIASKSHGKASASNPFQKIWTHKDEIILLKAVSQLLPLEGIYPTGKQSESILFSCKDQLSFSAMASQLYHKLRVLRKNYRRTIDKGAEDSFSDSKERSIFHLCQKIWGGDDKEENGQTSSDEDEDEDEDEDDRETQTKVQDVSKYPYLSEVVDELSKNNQGFDLYYQDAFRGLDESTAELYESAFEKHKRKEGNLGFKKIELITKFVRFLSKQKLVD